MAITASDLVLVTGANGHVAQHVVSQLLSHPSDVRVRGTVRSSSSAQRMQNIFKSSIISGRLEVVIVPDMTVDGAFDQAIQGATYVAHIASPLNLAPKDVETDLLIPAINGATSMLKSAMKEPRVKGVVITSSLVAAFDPQHGFRPGYTYSAADWNPITYDEAADPNLDLNQYPEEWRPWITYMASRKLAEKAAWDFHSKHMPTWSLSTILPTFICGPSVLPLEKGAGSLTFSTGLVWRTATGNEALFHNDFPYWVDVRDVARAHIQALTLPAAWGKRLILAPQSLLFSDIADIVRANFPDMSPSKDKQQVTHYSIDSDLPLSTLELGSWISHERMIVDMIKQVKASTINNSAQ